MISKLVSHFNQNGYWINVADCGCEYIEKKMNGREERNCKKECKSPEERKKRTQELLDTKVDFSQPKKKIPRQKKEKKE